ncbi:MAG: hypothetical protein SFV17_19360 [Candidatus Obscuribacter sp.]|nr:hypothetical protein [Candidatus Obscuribacter sp.]
MMMSQVFQFKSLKKTSHSFLNDERTLLPAAYEKLGMKKEAAQELARAKKIRARM